MKINIEKSQDHYRADCLDFPGSPPVGLGETPEMAVACLMWRVLFQTDFSDTKWINYIKREEPIIVNGVKWAWPKSYLGA